MNKGRRLFLKFSTTATAPLTVAGLQANPVVPGVSLISAGPAKGHSCYDETNDQMVPMYADATTLAQVMQVATASYVNGLRVNVGHYSGIGEACGRLTALRIDGDKLRGDLNLFRTFTQFAHICELVTTIPDTFGLSIDFDGEPEIIDGKGFARCAEIYSCDLVDTPAANEGGLFSANLPPSLKALSRLFDNSQPPNPTNPKKTMDPVPATPTTPATPETPAALTEARVNELIAAALTAVNTTITGLTTRVAAVEASLASDAATDDAPAAFRAIRKDFTALSKTVSETGTKLARRFGIEFAARAGATPLENPAGGNPEGDTRKPWEIPASERASQTLELRK